MTMTEYGDPSMPSDSPVIITDGSTSISSGPGDFTEVTPNTRYGGALQLQSNGACRIRFR